MAKQTDIEFPIEFSTLEKCQVSALIDECKSMVRAYNGDFTAPWLLSPIHSLSWRISKGGATRHVDEELLDYYEYQWATKLSDGSNLISPENRNLLQSMQRLAFLVRELPGGPTTLTTHKSFLWSLNFFVRWMFVHSQVLDPRNFGFTRMTRQHFTDLFLDLGKGGVVFALQYPQRFIQSVFPLALDRPPDPEELNSPLSLTANTCAEVSIWLKNNNYLIRRDRSHAFDLTLRPSSVAKLINVDTDMIKGGPKWHAFLIQFDINEQNSENTNRLILGGCSSRREMPTQRMLDSDEAKESYCSEKTLEKYHSDFKYLIRLKRHLPNFCPDPMQFKSQELKKVIINNSRQSNHTPWIPLPIAMTYTTESLRWVHVYGDDLVTIFINSYGDLHRRGLLVSAPMPDSEIPSGAELTAMAKDFTSKRDNYIAKIMFPVSLKPLNITGFGCYANMNGQKAFRKLRESPSMLDVIMILIGAITVVITMTKPMRESEFRALKNNCLTYIAGDGYWLSHSVRKNNFEDILPEDARPIPAIAARAIQLLRRLTEGLKDIVRNTDHWLNECLLTLPSFGQFEASLSVPTSSRLLQLLDTFCDYVALPPDKKGRRWYVRVHEMRKSFLITFFWTYRYASLDAARWIAGHSDASHVYAYIQANFPGEELPSLEAEYASQVLREYQQYGVDTDHQNVDLLYSAVCKHFSVRDVSWIDEATLVSWLELQFESNEFEIIPHSIRNPDGGAATQISFRVSSVNGLENKNG